MLELSTVVPASRGRKVYLFLPCFLPLSRARSAFAENLCDESVPKRLRSRLSYLLATGNLSGRHVASRAVIGGPAERCIYTWPSEVDGYDVRFSGCRCRACDEDNYSTTVGCHNEAPFARPSWSSSLF